MACRTVWYGLRLTYDIVVPAPGSSLRETYRHLDELQAKAAKGFQFNVTPDQITAKSLQGFIKQWPATVLPQPADNIPLTIIHTMDSIPDTDHMHYESVPFDLDPRYAVDPSSTQTVDYVYDGAAQHNTIDVTELKCLEDDLSADQAFKKLTAATAKQSYTSQLQSLAGLRGHLQATYRHIGIAAATMRLNIVCALTPNALADWQNQAWSALFESAQAAFYANQQALQVQIEQLQARLADVDTLTLRREENDEIMKCVLRWMLGPAFDFMPQNVQALFNGPDIAWGISFGTANGSELALSQQQWTTVLQYEQVVRFINDAIDWDNVNYFLYSYFWDSPPSWENIRQIQHPDSTRQAFLRAGSARVVLTIRKGWELDWVQFAEGGTFGGGALPEDHPYLDIAQEIQDYDNTNYPGIPPANPGTVPDDGSYVATTSIDQLVPSGGKAVTINVASNVGFNVGYNAVIDSYQAIIPGSKPPATAQESQLIINVSNDGKQLTVKQIVNPHGAAGSFAVRQAGESGLLISEWFEYTPSSGTDIAVTSNLATIN
jgi:hypothetical protein